MNWLRTHGDISKKCNSNETGGAVADVATVEDERQTRFINGAVADAATAESDIDTSSLLAHNACVLKLFSLFVQYVLCH